MNNDDISNILNNFSDILKEKNIDLNNIINSNAENNTTSSNFKEENNQSSIDIDTILKLKEIISKINANQNSPRNNLLHSLEPYLEDTKKEKLSKYIQIANLISVIEELDLGFVFLDKNKKGYDFILIITLFLLIL
jgi:hypothetical protein